MHDQRKGGRWARQSAILCTDTTFHRYLEARLRWEKGLSRDELPEGVCTKQDAADFMRERCGIASRADLDHNPEAVEIFIKIRKHWQAWMAKHGLSPQQVPSRRR
ncbi:hypothetical protein [Halomonas sp. I5-271120]|uniref:hypothetical protein n=1 Tax=Halomonas sp. I5-271120 TaxID=3061632 RepID=UPI0027144CF7|nr:hypothetical protein [Halomonas sp. I5-271120]